MNGNCYEMKRKMKEGRHNDHVCVMECNKHLHKIAAQTEHKVKKTHKWKNGKNIDSWKNGENTDISCNTKKVYFIITIKSITYK